MDILRLSGVFTFLSGLSHMTIQSYSHVGIYFYLVAFLIIGLVQLLVGILKMRGMITDRLFWISTLINGGATFYWLYTRTIHTPFIGEVENFTFLGVGVVVLQLLSVVILCVERKSLRLATAVFMFSFLLGTGSFVGAIGLEKVAPGLKGTGVHSHGGDSHSDDDDHGHAPFVEDEIIEDKTQEAVDLIPEASDFIQKKDEHAEDAPHGHGEDDAH